jgi:hypothetical protein
MYQLLTKLKPETKEMNEIITQLRDLIYALLLQWQDFEHFMGTYQAIRISMLATTRTQCSLAELFPWGQRNLNTEKFMTETKVDLRPRKTTGEMKRFNANDSYSLDHVLLPGAGSVIDIVTAFKNVLLLGQTKRYNDKPFTMDIVQQEAQRVADAVKKPYLLLVISNAPSPYKNPEEIPSQCLVMGSDDLKHYLGSILHDQVLLRLEGMLVNVNVAGIYELEMVPNLGRISALKIENERAKRPFVDWKDLCSRVNRLNTSVNNYLIYDKSCSRPAQEHF